MKYNVDLTENRIFSGPFSMLGSLEARMLVQEIAMVANGVRQVHSDGDLADPNHELYYTGNRSDRHLKMYCRREEAQESYCDCCGRPLSYVPWREDNYSKLCKTCDRFDDKFERLSSKLIRIPYYEIVLSQREDNEFQRPLDNIFLWD